MSRYFVHINGGLFQGICHQEIQAAEQGCSCPTKEIYAARMPPPYRLRFEMVGQSRPRDAATPLLSLGFLCLIIGQGAGQMIVPFSNPFG